MYMFGKGSSGGKGIYTCTKHIIHYYIQTFVYLWRISYIKLNHKRLLIKTVSGEIKDCCIIFFYNLVNK